MKSKLFGVTLLTLAISVLPGCKLPGANSMKMSLPGIEPATSFYANGFPTDLRVDEQGHVDIHDFPRQYHFLTKKYVNSVNGMAERYHTVMPVYLPFTKAIDVDSMSDWDTDYASPDAPIQLIDVDPDSSEYGRRFPLSLSVTKTADQYRPRHLLQVYPTMGFALRPDTTYALIVTDETPLAEINYWQQDPQLGAVLGVASDDIQLPEAVSKTYQPLRDFLNAENLDPQHIVGATVWTTGDPVARFYQGAARIAEKAQQLDQLPVSNVEALVDYPEFCVIRGDVEVPGYQKGVVPFVLKGGQIEWDQSGAPIEQYHRTTEFVVTIPKDMTMPENGYPLLSYVHGAAGIARQVYERGDFDYYDLTRYPYYIAKEGEGPSQIAAQRGWASSGFGGHLSVDHLPEWGVATIPAGFNPFNPDAFSNNYVTITWEQIYFRRILQQLRVDPDLCPEADVGAGQTAFRFDTNNEVSMGQSLGVWGAALKIVADPKPYKGLILGGSGGTWTKTMNSSAIYRLGFNTLVVNQLPFQGFDDAHPFLMLAEWAFGATDLSLNMENMMKYPTKAPPDVIAFSGFHDEIFPDTAQRVTYMALGADLLGEDIGSKPNNTMMPHMELAGANQLAYPASQNFQTPYGDRLNVVMRYRGKNIALLNSGHEVMFEDDEIKHQYGCFLEYLSNGQPPIMSVGTLQGDACL
ncbi:hypothetical protein [Ketobacter sp.]